MLDILISLYQQIAKKQWEIIKIRGISLIQIIPS